jgi:hypothetical protein
MSFVISSYACPDLQDRFRDTKTSVSMRLSGFCPFCPNPYKKQKRLIYLLSILLQNHMEIRIEGQKRQKGQNLKNVENTEVLTP